MDGENNGKPYFLMDDLGVPLFLETPTCVRGGGLLSIHSTLDQFERFVDFDPISIPGLKTHQYQVGWREKAG